MKIRFSYTSGFGGSPPYSEDFDLEDVLPPFLATHVRTNNKGAESQTVQTVLDREVTNWMGEQVDCWWEIINE